MTITGKKILLIISGGIAAYKSLELIRSLKKQGAQIRCILTKSGAEFVTPLSISALCEHPVYSDLWSLKDETEMGHIRLSREADLVLVAPATANIIAKFANGLADDLASTTLLASNTPLIMAPAMNHVMWHNNSTQKNIQTLEKRGVKIIGPSSGDMACGEFGMGRMIEPDIITEAVQKFFSPKPLNGFSALVTSGPTYEPIDPVRFIGNRSSGKQGHAIATALHEAGATVTLVTGPVALPAPTGVKTIYIETANDMLAACLNALPCDIAVCAAAVADWRPEAPHTQKMKKRADISAPEINLTQNPDILSTISLHEKRPELVIGFAAETENLIHYAKTKLETKKCDWIVANLVNSGVGNVFGSDQNEITLITKDYENHTPAPWPIMTKEQVAYELVKNIVTELQRKNRHGQQQRSNET